MTESRNKQYTDHSQAPEFEEEGKENLSSEGDETDVKERSYLAKPPKIQQEKFNDLSRKFSRNPGFSQVGNFKTDVPTEDTTKLHSAKFLSQKSVASKEAEEVSSCGGNVIPTGIISRARRSAQKNSKIPHNLNRSRNAGRNNHSRNSSNLERVTSNILTDKLRDTLENSKKKGSRYSMASNHPKSGEKSNILKEDGKLKESESGNTRLKKVYQKAYYKNKVNNQVLGDIIKNNNGTNFGSKGHLQTEKPHSKDKYKRIHSKNTKNHSLNNKENHAKNQHDSFDEFRDKNSSTEVYNLNQYCSAANLNAFGSKNFSLPKNMILSKNRSRDNTGFGSPTMRRVEGEKEENKGAFDSIMAKHGLLKDLNNLNWFNAFCKQSPLRHQRSLDYCYQSTNSSLYPNTNQGPTHMKTWTQQNLNLYNRKQNCISPESVTSQFSPTETMQNPHDIAGRTMDSNGYSFPFQRRARSASPPKDPEIAQKIAETLSPRHNNEKKTSAVDELLEDQVMFLQDPLKSQNSIHSRIGSGSFKSRKPIVANPKLFFIGGPGNMTHKGSDEPICIPSDKMKVLSKAINHYLNGEYDKIPDNSRENKLIENDLCTHDLKGHDISDGNEHDLTDEAAAKKWEVDDWLQDNSGPTENSLEGKHQDGFDPFAQVKEESYQPQSSLYKKQPAAGDGMTPANIMEIIQNSQKVQEKPVVKNTSKYVSLTTNEEEVVEKNIIVDDADFELENCLEEDEEWILQSFNAKKRLEEQQRQREIEEKQKEELQIKIMSKPPQPTPSTNERLWSLKETVKIEEPDLSSEAVKPRRRRKNSKHRRTESKTFNKDFLESLAQQCPS